jgi:hypothetical protein
MSSDKEFDELERQVKTLEVGVKRKPLDFQKYKYGLIPVALIAVVMVGFVATWFGSSGSPSGLATADLADEAASMNSEPDTIINEPVNETKVNWIEEETECGEPVNES